MKNFKNFTKIISISFGIIFFLTAILTAGENDYFKNLTDNGCKVNVEKGQKIIDCPSMFFTEISPDNQANDEEKEYQLNIAKAGEKMRKAQEEVKKEGWTLRPDRKLHPKADEKKEEVTITSLSSNKAVQFIEKKSTAEKGENWTLKGASINGENISYNKEWDSNIDEIVKKLKDNCKLCANIIGTADQTPINPTVGDKLDKIMPGASNSIHEQHAFQRAQKLSMIFQQKQIPISRITVNYKVNQLFAGAYVTLSPCSFDYCAELKKMTTTSTSTTTITNEKQRIPSFRGECPAKDPLSGDTCEQKETGATMIYKNDLSLKRISPLFFPDCSNAVGEIKGDTCKKSTGDILMFNGRKWETYMAYQRNVLTVTEKLFFQGILLRATFDYLPTKQDKSRKQFIGEVALLLMPTDYLGFFPYAGLGVGIEKEDTQKILSSGLDIPIKIQGKDIYNGWRLIPGFKTDLFDFNLENSKRYDILFKLGIGYSFFEVGGYLGGVVEKGKEQKEIENGLVHIYTETEKSLVIGGFINAGYPFKF